MGASGLFAGIGHPAQANTVLLTPESLSRCPMRVDAWLPNLVVAAGATGLAPAGRHAGWRDDREDRQWIRRVTR